MASMQVARYVLAAEFALGGQARVTPVLTPQVNAFVLGKATDFFRNLSFIPGRTAEAKTQTLGAVMCVASALLAIPQRWTTLRFRIGTVVLGGALSTLLLVGEATIQGDIWLPAINIGLAAWLVYQDLI